jgi:hypothetical protein
MHLRWIGCQDQTVKGLTETYRFYLHCHIQDDSQNLQLKTDIVFPSSFTRGPNPYHPHPKLPWCIALVHQPGMGPSAHGASPWLVRTAARAVLEVGGATVHYTTRPPPRAEEARELSVVRRLWEAYEVGGGLRLSRFVFCRDLSYFRCCAGVGGAEGRSEDGGKVGLPALEVALAFPQATPASLFPPAGEISPALFHLV